MGPLFSLLVVAIVGTIAVTVLFLLSLIVMPARYAVLFAPLIVISGGAGCALGAIAQLPWYPPGPTVLTAADATRWFQITGGGGLLLTLASGSLFFRWMRSRR